MKRRCSLVAVCCIVILAPLLAQSGDEYLNWSAGNCESIGRSMFVRGRVGGFWDTRGLATETSYNYKLQATWLTPEVIRATARLQGLRSRLSADEVRSLVTEGEAAGDTVVLVEIDPREGSGVIPSDWEAMLQPKGNAAVVAHGEDKPELRRARSLAGVMKRNYDYDQFWIVFPLFDQHGAPLFHDSNREAELIVRVAGKEGRVAFPITASVRDRIAKLQSARLARHP
jgi:hypothetical protein